MEVNCMYTKKKEFKIDEELEKIIAVQTDKLNLTMSEYIRGLIKQDYILNNLESVTDFKADLKQAIKELNIIGNNLNQLARYCNKEKKILETEQWEVRHLVDKLILIFNKL